MSYILEALKKSEQERARERGALPDIKSVHTPTSKLHTEDRNWWPIILVAVLVIAGALIAAVYVIRMAPLTENVAESDLPVVEEPAASAETAIEKKAPRATVDSSSTVGSSAETAQASAMPEQKQPKVVFSKQQLKHDDEIGNVNEQKQSSVAVEPNRPAQVAQKESAATVDEPESSTVAISEIPDSVRKKIPNIAFEGHIYSSTPERRSIMVNGRKMREGEVVGDRLLIRQITPEGAEFEYEGYRFRLNALQDWSFK